MKVWLNTYAISMVAVVLMAPRCNAEWTSVGWFGDKPAARREVSYFWTYSEDTVGNILI